MAAQWLRQQQHKRRQQQQHKQRRQQQHKQRWQQAALSSRDGAVAIRDRDALFCLLKPHMAASGSNGLRQQQSAAALFS
jgi:hypothetical protein